MRDSKAALKVARAEKQAERQAEEAAAARRHNSAQGWVTVDIDLARLEREDNAKKAQLESATDAARRGVSEEMERMFDERIFLASTARGPRWRRGPCSCWPKTARRSWPSSSA